ncbi:MAG: hypothetical protein E6R13_03615 [Spirochaetes bacterium]|nr:MAG: hypothetical protein E6R13_03615 [Spirochaetota bacterium]
MYTRFPSLIVKTGSAGGSYDSDAQAFFTAAGITSTTEKDAWNTFVNSAKSAGYYSKFYGFWPMLGGTSSTCKYNAINPSAFEMVWEGTPSFTSAGVKSNSVSDFGGTSGDFNALAEGWTSTNSMLGYYISTPMNANELAITDNSFQTFISGYSVTQGLSNLGGIYNFVSKSYTNGCCILNNYIGTKKYYHQGTERATFTGTAVYYGGTIIILGDGSSFYYSSGRMSAAFVGDGLTSTEISNFQTHIQTFQTSLGRNI